MADRPTVTLVLDDNGHVVIQGATGYPAPYLTADGVGLDSTAIPARTVMLAGRFGTALPLDWDVPPGALAVLAALVRDISGWF